MKYKNLLIFMVSMLVFVCVSGTAFAQDIWVGSDDKDAGRCEIYLNSDSITRKGPPGKAPARNYIYKCTLKWVNSQGNLLFTEQVEYKFLSFPYTTEDGKQTLARTWFYAVSRNGNKLEDGKLKQGKEYYQQAFDHIKAKYQFKK